MAKHAYQSSDVHTARFLKYFRPFFNMTIIHERVNLKYEHGINMCSMFKQCIVLCISEKLFMNVILFKISKSSHKGQASYIMKGSRKSSCLNSTKKILTLPKVDKNNKAMSVHLAKKCFFVRRCS